MQSNSRSRLSTSSILKQLPSNTKPSPPALPEKAIKTFTEYDQVYVLGVNAEFLNEKVKSIIQYTKNTYPTTRINGSQINVSDAKELFQENGNTDLYDSGYLYAVNVTPILPALISMTIVLTMSKWNCVFPPLNCHGAALLASGILPCATNKSYKPISGYGGIVEEGVTTVSPENLRAGDIVFSFPPDHSFVFIDQDICLSANGCYASLEIHRTEDLLKEYNVRLNDSNGQPSNVTIYRRNPDRNYPASVTDDMVNFLINKTLLHSHEQEKQLFPVLKNIHLTYQQADDTEKRLYEYIYNEVKHGLSASLIEQVENNRQSYHEGVTKRFTPQTI